MHIYNNIKNYIGDNNNFICILDNKIYLYNVLFIYEISNSKLVVLLNNKRVSIIGKNIELIKSYNREIILNGLIERVLIDEDIN